MIQMPLATYVLYHSEFSDGECIFNMIYQLLCRDIEKPLTDGIDIPVYLRTGKENDHIFEIDFSQSQKTAIIVLIDEKMFCSQTWRTYIEGLISQLSDSVKMYCIGLCDYAFEITSNSEKIQSIKLDSYSFVDNWDKIQIRLLDSLYRLLTNPEEKISLFISHAKKDSKDLAKQLRDYIRSNTKLDSFFDENDILDGNDFAKQIEHNVTNALLLVLKSDLYADREWCRNEVLIAKRHSIPTVIVNCVKERVKRTFPYMGNCPMIQYKDTNWPSIIILLLRAALNQVYQKKLLSTLNNKYKGITGYIEQAPELFSFLQFDNSISQNILYPEPPLGKEEMAVLLDYNSNIHFLTPTEAVAKVHNKLKGGKIAFSISDCEDIHERGCSKSMLKDIVLELSRYILKEGGLLFYGGDLRKGGYTEAFEDFSYQYGEQEKADRQMMYFTNYFAWPIYLSMSESIKMEFIHKRVNIQLVKAPDNCTDSTIFLPPVGNDNLSIWADSLTKMRYEMEKSVDARIILGGQVSGFKGKYAGILEEFLIAAQAGHPIYLIGGFGGMAKCISEIIETKSNVDLLQKAEINPNYKSFIEFYNTTHEDKINYDSIYETIKQYKFNNGLTKDENIELFHTTNILEIVSLILKGLNTILA